MTSQELKELLELVFPVVKDEISEDNGSISFSVEVEDPDKLESYYSKLYALENFISYSGYSLYMQEDEEYFGAQMTRPNR